MILRRGRRGECINEMYKGRGTGDKGRKAIFQIMNSIDFIILLIHNDWFEMSIDCNLKNSGAVPLVPCPLSPSLLKESYEQHKNPQTTQSLRLPNQKHQRRDAR